MNSMVNISTFTGPVSNIARSFAEQCARQQATPEKSQQVLLNTLSVAFVNFYLECMGFETDLEASDSWHPLEQTLMDIGDLHLNNLGKLECRPVLENSQFVYVPPEVQSNRIGYVAVQISKSLQSAKLLGFVKQVSVDNLPMNELQPLSDLLEHLECWKLELANSSNKKFVSLKRWVDNIFENGWESIESILLTEPSWQFRGPGEKAKNSVERAKLIDFNINTTRTSVVIIVYVSQDESNYDENKILVELHPKNGQEYLPPLLHIMILDEEGTAFMEAKAKNDNKKIALEFSASVGDNFSIKTVLGDVSVIENFII